MSRFMSDDAMAAALGVSSPQSPHPGASKSPSHLLIRVFDHSDDFCSSVSLWSDVMISHS